MTERAEKTNDTSKLKKELHGVKPMTPLWMNKSWMIISPPLNIDLLFQLFWACFMQNWSESCPDPLNTIYTWLISVWLSVDEKKICHMLFEIRHAVMSACRTLPLSIWLWISDKSQCNIMITNLNMRVDSSAKHRDLELYYSDKLLHWFSCRGLWVFVD